MLLCFPYFDHDAFTHHALHVLNAPDSDWATNATWH